MTKRVLFPMVAVCVAMTLVCGCAKKNKPVDVKGPGKEVLIDDPLPQGDFTDLKPMDVKFQTVVFAYDSFRVESTENLKVEQVAQFMKSNGDARLVCSGHCDERGTKEYNDALGMNRALAVRAYLIHLGIPAEHVQVKSFGEEQPLDPGHSEVSWRKNRRVEFAMYH